MRYAHQVTMFRKGVFTFHYSVLCLPAFVVSLKFCNFNCVIFVLSFQSASQPERALLVHSKYDYASINFMNWDWDALLCDLTSHCSSFFHFIITLAFIQLVRLCFVRGYFLHYYYDWRCCFIIISFVFSLSLVWLNQQFEDWHCICVSKRMHIHIQLNKLKPLWMTIESTSSIILPLRSISLLFCISQMSFMR